MAILKALCAGFSAAGLVLLVCRWVALPLIDQYDWVQHVGIGLVVAGSLGFRSVSDELHKGIAAVAAVAMGAIAFGVFMVAIRPVPAADVALVKKKFPGITISLPGNAPTQDSTQSANGMYKTDKVGKRRGVVQVNWQPGHTEISPEDYARLLGAATPMRVGKIETTAVTVNGHTGRRMAIPVKDEVMLVTTWHCKPHDRDYSIGTLILESKAASLAFHSRITDSAHCHEGEKPKATVRIPRLTIGPEYGFDDQSASPVFRTLDGGELAIQPIARSVVGPINSKPNMVLEMFKMIPNTTDVAQDGPQQTVTGSAGFRRMTRVRYTESGVPQLASVTAIDCNADQSFLLMHSYPRKEQRTGAEAVLASAACPGKGPPQTHPSLRDVLTKACDAKDARGCYMLGSIAQHAEPPRTDEARKLLSRGCDLEHATACNDLGVLEAASGGPDAANRAKVLYDKACKLGEKLGCANAGRAETPQR